MVMHNNEREECCLRTLVDHKRKRYDNAVDVVVRLHDRTDPSTERTTPPSSAHVQPDDVPRTPIQPSVEGEFRQHNVVVMLPLELALDFPEEERMKPTPTRSRNPTPLARPS